MNPQFAQLFEAIDRMDPDGFVRFLTDDGSFRFGKIPAIRGRPAIRDAVAHFFASIGGLSHHITGIYEQGDTAIVEGEVTYTRKDGSRITIPFADFFTLSRPLFGSSDGSDPSDISAARLTPSLIRDYRIYIAPPPLLLHITAR
jgi:hypothetical protein